MGCVGKLSNYQRNAPLDDLIRGERGRARIEFLASDQRPPILAQARSGHQRMVLAGARFEDFVLKTRGQHLRVSSGTLGHARVS